MLAQRDAAALALIYAGCSAVFGTLLMRLRRTKGLELTQASPRRSARMRAHSACGKPRTCTCGGCALVRPRQRARREACSRARARRGCRHPPVAHCAAATPPPLTPPSHLRGCTAAAAATAAAAVTAGAGTIDAAPPRHARCGACLWRTTRRAWWRLRRAAGGATAESWGCCHRRGGGGGRRLRRSRRRLAAPRGVRVGDAAAHIVVSSGACRLARRFIMLCVADGIDTGSSSCPHMSERSVACELSFVCAVRVPVLRQVARHD
jgi:hypothetical protein